MVSEAAVRDALRDHVLASTHGAREALEELWVPISNERADLAVIGEWMHGFEIKTHGDTLKRLPRQVCAYGRLFDCCTAVVAEKHLDRAAAIVPDWWGITTVAINGGVAFSAVRPARRNTLIDPETLVRLLWRDEVFAALLDLGAAPDPRAPRGSLWTELLRTATLAQLKAAVRRALLGRDQAQARIPTRRFAPQVAAAVAGP
jgi:hypothetical protein